MGSLNTVDWIVIGGYFLVVLVIAAWATWQEKRRQESSVDYFLAGRHAGWAIIGGSLFASNIGAEHLVGLAGNGAKGGVAVGQFEVLASLILLVLAWVFAPFYVRSGVFTMPEFLERRYSPAARYYLALVSIVAYILTKISVNIAAAGIVLTTLGVDFWLGTLSVVAITGIYTILGGLRAVLYTDFLQMVVFVAASVALMAIGLSELGGWQALREATPSEHWDMWLPASHPDFPWTGILFGAPLLGLWYWCTDQYIVQRVLSARTLVQAQRGAIFASYLKLLPLFLFVLPGVLAYALAQSGKVQFDTPDQALPALIRQMLPSGLRGLVVAGLLAAVMSSLSSVYNSCSTLITWDIYRKWRPSASDRELVLAGQCFTVLTVVAGILWIPFMKNVSRQLYEYLQSVQAYISPPIAAVFLLGISWRRATAAGAVASLYTGFVLGLFRLVLELNYQSLPDGFLKEIAAMNFLHFAIVLFTVSTGVLVVISFLTPPVPSERLEGVSFSYGERKQRAESARGELNKGWRLNLLLSAFVVAAVSLIWWYFSGK
jgi:SSS family solute:Na+ symporter